jgi:intracellular sulfur oxidation DsrE/DsrF family protein
VSIVPTSSRRGFVAQLGRIASLGVLSSLVATRTAHAEPRIDDAIAPGDWDLSWLNRLSGATDRGVFDWSAIDTPLASPPESTPLDYAARYLDGCEAAYGSASAARAVVVIRHIATPAALNDAAWSRYAVGEVFKIIDPDTQKPAVRNPFWSSSAHGPDAPPTLQELVGRGVIVLVCNLALTNRAAQIARARGEDPAALHEALLGALVPNAFVVPSGVWGLVRAQNAGCGIMRA